MSRRQRHCARRRRERDAAALGLVDMLETLVSDVVGRWPTPEDREWLVAQRAAAAAAAPPPKPATPAKRRALPRGARRSIEPAPASFWPEAHAFYDGDDDAPALRLAPG